MSDISYKNLQSPLTVKVEWKRNSAEPPLTLSISALMLNQRTGLIDKLEDFVFYGSKMSNDGILSEDKSIKCDPVDFKKGFGTEGVYKMSIDLKKVKVDVDKIRIVVSINPKVEDYPQIGFDTLLTTQFTIEDSAGVSYSCDLAKDSDSGCRCIDIGLVKRWGDNWRFEEEMELMLGGLELVYNEYMCDSIINSNPFSKIGDLSIIENKYKETEENTKITKDGDISIIKKVKEYTTTTIKKISEFGKDAPKRKGVRFQNAGQQTGSVNPEGLTATHASSDSRHRKGSRYKINDTGENPSQNSAPNSQKSFVEGKATSNPADGKTRKGTRYKNVETNDENKDIEHSKSDIQQNKRRGVKFKKQL